MKEMKRIRTAIIGYGYSAQTFHEPFLRTLPQFELVAASGSQATKAKDKWPSLTVFATAKELLQHTETDLVIITTPNQSHFELAIQVLEKGCHLLVDKPLCTTLEEALKLKDVANQSKGTLNVFHNRRFDGDFLTLKSIVDQQQLGTIHRFESHFDRARPQPKYRWREIPGAGSGIWYDLGPHLIDQAIQLFGMPKSINANIRILRPSARVDDCFNINLEYDVNEVLLSSSPYCFGRPLRFDLQGERGRYVKYGLDVQESKLVNDQAFTSPSWSAEEFANYGRLHTQDSNERICTEPGNYQAFFEKLSETINQSRPAVVSVDDAIKVMQILEAGKQSSIEGRRLPLG